jgi:hypothetical protein
MPEDQPGVVPLVIAAERLGLSTEAVRKRIQRGTLAGRKVGGAWFVENSVLPPPSEWQDESAPPSGLSADDVRLSAGHNSVDLKPLVEMIERLHEENRRLIEASTLWQVRARQAEEQLAALESGPISSMPQDANPGPLRGDLRAEASEPLKPVSDRLALRWRAWWRRMRGMG